ncbi:MAG: hypothetical protein HC799_19060 [Limnothrix sp. RL_2_0]|nr:hypothetical protein [Limnothrix sp. RL_2_0]
MTFSSKMAKFVDDFIHKLQLSHKNQLSSLQPQFATIAATDQQTQQVEEV